LNFRRAAVTGGAGFIGSHIIDHLLARGTEVIAIDNLSEGDGSNLDHRAGLYVCDVREEERLKHILEGVDVLFHHAAIASVPRCSNEPLEGFSVNVQGTMAVANALQAVSPNARMVFASSAAVYGKALEPNKYTEQCQAKPASVYGASKYMAEIGLQSLCDAYGLDVRIVRYANVYGPRQPRYILFDMYRKVKASLGEVEILGSGRQLRDFVYVDDAVDATIQVACMEPADVNVFNIGTGRATSVLDLAASVCAEMGRCDLTLRPTRESWLGDVDYLLLDPGRILSVWNGPTVTLSAGIRKFISWIESRNPIAMTAD
jgi:UDP-glucose 4-epimerase